MKNSVINGIDYGPLAGLIGKWKGSDGMDIAPDPSGIEKNPFFETLVFEAGGDVTNANEQKLSIVSYHEVVSRKSDQKVFHDQIGYWLWDPSTNIVMQTLTIPRAVTLIAGGKATIHPDGSVTLDVLAEENHPEWGIVQSGYMKKKARTTKFTHTLKIKGDTIEYRETTFVDIYGKKSFEHVDSDTLKRV